MADPRGRVSDQQQNRPGAPEGRARDLISAPQTKNFSARGGQIFVVESPPAGLTVILPPPDPSSRNDQIWLMLRNTNPVRVICLDGKVNDAQIETNAAVGLKVYIQDGLEGWFTPASGGGSTVLAGNSLSFSGTTLNYSGTTSILTLAGITGAQGTVDISSIVCGGTVAVSGPVGNWSISGFTSAPIKPDGFWFCLATANTAFTGTLIEDAVAAVGDRLRMTGSADVTFQAIQAIIYKTPSTLGGSPRWRCVVGSPAASSSGLTHQQVLTRVSMRA